MGRTTLKQVLRGENITYKKTQYVSQYDCVIDMPGEYAENLDLAHTIDLYAAESDVVRNCVKCGQNPNSLYPPNITPLGNRDEVGIVTKIDHWAANSTAGSRMAKNSLGCKKNIFFTSAYYWRGKSKKSLNSCGKNMTFCPVEKVMDALHKESFGKQAELPHYHLQ